VKRGWGDLYGKGASRLRSHHNSASDRLQTCTQGYILCRTPNRDQLIQFKGRIPHISITIDVLFIKHEELSTGVLVLSVQNLVMSIALLGCTWLK
jgi:hypothetical protein